MRATSLIQKIKISSLIILASYSYSFSPAKDFKKILYINSYHIGYPWSYELVTGFKSVLDTATTITYYTEFMDTKRFLNENTFPDFYKYLTKKYKHTHFDLIALSDNNAVDFYLKYQDSTIFYNKPMVFCGVSNINDYDFSDKDIYGIVEGREMTQILYSMTRLFPERDTVHVIMDKTYTSQIYKSLFEKYYKEYKKPNFKYVSNLPIDSIPPYIKRLGDHSMVYLFDVNLDSTQGFLPGNRMLDKFNVQFNVPIFSGVVKDYDWVLGGESNAGNIHGETLAKIAYKLLNNEVVEPKIVYPEKFLMYNYNELKRFNVDLSLLPRNAMISNKPESVFIRFKQLIIFNSIFIVLLFGIILVLYTNNRNQKRFRKKLIKARDIALQSEAIKSTFIANVSHELRTPLNAIIGFTEILLKEDLLPERKEFVKLINESSITLEKLVNDVLDLSLIDANEVLLNSENIYLPAFINQVLHQNLKHIEDINKTDLTIKLNIPDKTPETIFCDKYRLNQVLQNLISNAIKYSEEGTIIISYKLVKQKELSKKEDLAHFVFVADEYFLFSVEDNGIGIPKEKKKYIFERFSRLDQVYMGHHGGVGLGLNISKSLINIMGGEIWLSSKQGEGSTFSFILPRLNQNLRNVNDKTSTSDKI